MRYERKQSTQFLITTNMGKNTIIIIFTCFCTCETTRRGVLRCESVRAFNDGSRQQQGNNNFASQPYRKNNYHYHHHHHHHKNNKNFHQLIHSELLYFQKQLFPLCSSKQVFLKISQISQECTSALECLFKVSF